MSDKPAARDEFRIPVIEETAVLEKRTVETGRVRVRTVAEERSAWVRDALTREDVEVTRVRVEQPVDTIPAVRTEGDLTVIPLVEEVLVVEKRLVVREEIHIRRRTTVDPIEREVTLRSTRAVVDRDDNGSGNPKRTNKE